MSTRNYNNVTTLGTLSGPVSPTATSLTVSGFTQYPAVPFTVTINRNQPDEEVCLATAASTGLLTVTRGYDGTAGQTHAAGATVEHTAVAQDYGEANAHINSSASVHGVSGSVVGTQGSQTILNKTLTSPLCNADVTLGDAVVAAVPSGAGTRNLFRGIGTDGANKITVDASGNVQAASVATTGNVSATGNVAATANLSAGGTLSVTGTTTLTGATTATAAITANGGITVPTGKSVSLTDAPVAGTDAANKTYTDSGVLSATQWQLNGQTAAYTLAAADAHKVVEINAASAVAVTVPADASVNFPLGTVIRVARAGAGAVTISAAGGVTLSARGTLSVRKWGFVELRKQAANTWRVTGDLLGEPVLYRDNGAAANLSAAATTIGPRTIDPAALFGTGVGALVTLDARVLLDYVSGAAGYWYLNTLVNGSADSDDTAYIDTTGRTRGVLAATGSFTIAAGSTATVAQQVTPAGLVATVQQYVDATNNRLLTTVVPIFS